VNLYTNREGERERDRERERGSHDGRYFECMKRKGEEEKEEKKSEARKCSSSAADIISNSFHWFNVFDE
jgi:hypothetical protein